MPLSEQPDSLNLGGGAVGGTLLAAHDFVCPLPPVAAPVREPGVPVSTHRNSEGAKKMTICDKCGAEREYIDAACPGCGFHPKTVRELATSALLTAKFDAGEESFGTDKSILASIAQEIRAGRRPRLDEKELQRHERTVEAFLQIKPSQVYLTLLGMFMPAPILAVMRGIVVAIRMARH